MYGRKTELAVGVFLIVGIFSLFYLSVSLGGISIFGSPYYEVTAVFDSITGLNEAATVEVAGVSVGKVLNIELDGEQAKVTLGILKGISLSDDSVASIRTKGVIGDKFVKITPGGSDVKIEPGGEVIETESAISLEELISKYIFEK
jgi:phospholipid/cholesterol/gamma-HCH transport system substrate-binding protein